MAQSYYVPQCIRMERLIAPIGLLTPLRLRDVLSDNDNYNDVVAYASALAVSGVALAAAAALGVLSALAGLALWGAVPGHSRLASACAAVSFPATLIQSIVFLANGAAVSAGMVLGGGYDHSTNGAVPAAAACCAFLIIVPVAITVAVEVCAPARARRLVRAAAGAAKLSLCRVAVRPAVAAEALGPAIGDLRIAAFAFAPFFPFAVPIVLLIASAAVSASGRCELLPLVAGVVYGAYAALVAAFRPFLGVPHNTVEATLAAVAAGLLIGVYGAQPASGPEGALLTALVGLSNARYPFIVARLLRVRIAPFVVVSDAVREEGDGERSEQRAVHVLNIPDSTGCEGPIMNAEIVASPSASSPPLDQGQHSEDGEDGEPHSAFYSASVKRRPSSPSTGTSANSSQTASAVELRELPALAEEVDDDDDDDEVHEETTSESGSSESEFY